MNLHTCDLVLRLLKTKTTYLKSRPNKTGREGFGLYTGNQIIIKWYSYKQVKPLLDVCKKNKQQQLTLNINLVKQLHGKNFIKQQYKKHATKYRQ